MPAVLNLKLIRPLIFFCFFFFVGGVIYLSNASDVQARGLIAGCVSMGDVNNDGQITDADATATLGIVGGSPSTSYQNLRADVEDDNDIQASDANLISQYANFIINTFPVCSTPSKPLLPCSPTGNVYTSDSVVNKFDALYVLEDIGNVRTLSATQRENGDANNHGTSPSHQIPDGQLQSIDALDILRYVNAYGQAASPLSNFGPCYECDQASGPIVVSDVLNGNHPVPTNDWCLAELVPRNLVDPDASGPIYAGQVVNFNGDIKNESGIRNAGASISRFRLDFNQDGSYETTLSSPATGALPVLTSENETHNGWVASIGLWRIELCADVLFWVAELSEINNCSFQNFTVQAPPNNPPNTPTLISPANGTSTTTNWITNNPTFTAQVTDPDGGNVYAEFSYQTVSGNPTAPSTQNGSTVTSGSNSTLTKSPAIADGKYNWRARAFDPQGASSGYTGYWRVKKDSALPTANCGQPTYSGTTITVPGLSGTDPNTSPTRTASGVFNGVLERKVNTGSWTPVGTAFNGDVAGGGEEYTNNKTWSNYQETGSSGSTYSYRFTVNDRAGNASAVKTCGTSITVDPPPANPSNLSVEIDCNPGQTPRIIFSWLDNSVGETEFLLDVNHEQWLTATTDSNGSNNWGWKSVSAASGTGTIKTYTWDYQPGTFLNAGPPTQTAEGATYYWRVVANKSGNYSQHVYYNFPNGGTTTSTGGNPLVAQCLDDSTNLSFSSFCEADGTLSVQFNWQDNSIGESEYQIEVSTSKWITNQTNPGTVGYRHSLPANANSYLWKKNDPATHLTGGPPVFPTTLTGAMNGYIWRVRAKNTTNQTYSTWMYHSVGQTGNATTNPALATWNNSQECGYNLGVSWVGNAPNFASPFVAGQQVNSTLRITNTGVETAPGNLTIGAWNDRDGSGVSIPNCTNNPPIPQNNPPTPPSVVTGAGDTIATGNFIDVNLTFTAATNDGPYYFFVYVIPQCLSNESNYTNNKWEGLYNTDNPSWFETTGGGIAARTSINIDQAPFAPSHHGEFGSISGTTTSGVLNTAQGWRITGYGNNKVVEADVYPFLHEEFYAAAKASQGTSNCSFAAHYPNGNWCAGPTATFGAGSAVPTADAWWFVDGNVVIESNIITTGSPDPLFTIIASGNIKIKNNVTRVDALLVSDGEINITDSGLSEAGQQLVINGALYGARLNLVRKLATSGCGVPTCSNSEYPALVVNHDLRYIVGFTQLSRYTHFWQERSP